MEHDTWYTIQMHYMLKEQLSDGRSSQLILPCPAWNKSTKFAELIHTNQKCIIPIDIKQSHYKVHGPILKLVMRYRQWL